MYTSKLEVSAWPDYELLDSGEREKYERFGKYTLVRPEPKAIWKKSLSAEEWGKADAVYKRISERDGRWQYRTHISKSWEMKWQNLTFRIKPTGFKHLGIFPENAVHWQFIQDAVNKAGRPVNILNMFAYTGGCTLAALAAGAKVTHLDASRDAVDWAHENAKLSKLDHLPVRWIVDDASTFVKREIKRGRKYDGIILDPPKFGRAENGKVWKFDYDLPKLLQMCAQIISEKPLFVIINAYTVEYLSPTLANLLYQNFKNGTIDFGEVIISQKNSSMVLPTSIYATYKT